MECRVFSALGEILKGCKMIANVIVQGGGERMPNYVLKSKNRDLVRFELSSGTRGGHSMSVYWITEEDCLLPVSFDGTDTSLMNWLIWRMIPRHRTFAREILRSQGLREGDLIGQLTVSLGLSVNDTYWVVPQGENLQWKDYSLYRNSFSEALSLVAFTGYSHTIHRLSPSPEMTTNGQLPKTWRREGEQLILYKGATDPALYTTGGREPYSEYYAAQVAKAMGIEHVSYDLRQFKGILASTCRNFTSEDRAYIPAGKLLKTSNLDELHDLMEKTGSGQKFSDMVLLDAVIWNEDRHFGNFGFLQDTETGEILTLAPCFDHGLSLFSRLTDEKLFDQAAFQEYLEDTAFSLAGGLHNDLVRWNATKEDMKKLRKLYNFQFRRHEKYNLSEKRLAFLEKWIQNRARELTRLLENEEQE